MANDSRRTVRCQECSFIEARDEIELGNIELGNIELDNIELGNIEQRRSMISAAIRLVSAMRTATRSIASAEGRATSKRDSSTPMRATPGANKEALGSMKAHHGWFPSGSRPFWLR